MQILIFGFPNAVLRILDPGCLLNTLQMALCLPGRLHPPCPSREQAARGDGDTLAVRQPRDWSHRGSSRACGAFGASVQITHRHTDVLGGPPATPTCLVCLHRGRGARPVQKHTFFCRTGKPGSQDSRTTGPHINRSSRPAASRRPRQ